MKKVFFLGLIITFSLLGCDREDVFTDQATITGSDMRMCACCGGWFIDIGEDRLRFFELPKTSGIDLNKETFPLKVRLDWEKLDPACMDDLIKVKRIKKI